jgi:hypothetical protein
VSVGVIGSSESGHLMHVPSTIRVLTGCASVCPNWSTMWLMKDGCKRWMVCWSWSQEMEIPRVYLMGPRSEISQCLCSWDLKVAFSLGVVDVTIMSSTCTAKMVVSVSVYRW